MRARRPTLWFLARYRAATGFLRGIRRVAPYSSKARFRSGDGRLGEARCAADFSVAAAGNRGKCTAFALDADSPALLRKGAVEARGGQLDFLRGPLILRQRGAQIPPRVNRVGRCILSVADFRKNPSRSLSGCPEASASFCYLVQEAPGLSDGGLHLLYAPGGLYRFEAPLTFTACKAVSLGDATDGYLADPKKIAMTLHVGWGRASAQLLKRVLVDSEGKNMHLRPRADEVLSQPEICQVFEEAPHIPAAGTSTVAMLNEILQADLLFLDNIIALRAMDGFLEHPLLVPVRTKNPEEVRDAFCSSWVGVFGPPMSIQMDEGGEWECELWTELRLGRRIKLVLFGVGAPLDS